MMLPLTLRHILVRSSHNTGYTSYILSTYRKTTQLRISFPSRLQTRNMAFRKPNSSPPTHEMVYFPQMTSDLPASSHEFRRVLYTGLYSQVVLMSIPVGGDIGDEVHTVDQALTFTSGTGLATINGKDQVVKKGDLMVVPAGTQHQFVNTGKEPLVLYTIYSPAEHAPTTVHHTKEEGDREEEERRDEAPAWSRRSKEENEKAGLVKLSGKYD
ncbi:311a7fa7-4b2e-4aaf-8913-69c45b51a055 [Sclerotinia trifoliorum]|uniref:311a7fa7-4b2e-4aaf-8913-69c45b51a055 n=1 Tax=Sclerotinia trifoliorum TaxID=28548 RepID=A0A8H2VQJ2_9HELO|nr:311a7fa7-4b2e-4aaf-8913-69c45b51a055 [Sclerotinia trifoliorum]